MYGVPEQWMELNNYFLTTPRHHGGNIEKLHYNDVVMGAIASQITRLTIVFNRLFRHRSKKTSKLRVTGLCAGNSPDAGEFPAQMASNRINLQKIWLNICYPNTLLNSIFSDHKCTSCSWHGQTLHISHKRPVIRSLDVLQDAILKYLLKAHLSYRWYKAP